MLLKLCIFRKRLLAYLTHGFTDSSNLQPSKSNSSCIIIIVKQYPHEPEREKKLTEKCMWRIRTLEHMLGFVMEKYRCLWSSAGPLCHMFNVCYAHRRGKHIVVTLSVRPSVLLSVRPSVPVPCPTNNFKTTVAI